MGVFFFGMGYSSHAAARAIEKLVDQDVQIVGTTRSRPRAEELIRNGIRAHAFDGRAPGLMLAPDLIKSRHVIISIPPGEGGDPVLTQHRHELDQAEGLEWLCYFSSVGVYGNADGGWIDEDTPCETESDRARWRVEAEEKWRDYARQRHLPLAIFRIAGIYGPGRSSLNKLRDGTARRINKPGQVFNRVHVEDIGRITALALHSGLEGTYNLADDEPAPPQDLVTYAAKLLEMEPPVEEAFDKAAGYMWTPSEYPKKGADEDELASLRAYGLAVLDEAETGYARNYAGANESDPVAMTFEVQRRRIGNLRKEASKLDRGGTSVSEEKE
ncbi:MAG: SDR family oxidoreductase [Proteobacteria bacterium]|nr:SDR family oxidoreductase [Pseudomonadota bacterium]